MTKRWRVKQGTSLATVVAETYQAARDRAYLIGFKDPDSIVLMTEQGLAAAYRYLRDLVDDGIEYPDAHTKAVMRFGVDGDELSKLYDEQDAP